MDVDLNLTLLFAIVTLDEWIAWEWGDKNVGNDGCDVI